MTHFEVMLIIRMTPVRAMPKGKKIMLQMNCPNCCEVIKSPYLAELSSTHCGHCKEDVTVQDVFVATKGFTMHRDDLLKRIARFQKLLEEVEKEIQLFENSETVSKTTQKNIHNFYATLQELLIGARSNFRLEVPDDLPIEMDFKNNKEAGKLVNLSSEGASLEFIGMGERPRNKTEVTLQFVLPDVVEPLSLLAKVVWAREVKKDDGARPIKIGVKFMNLNAEVRDTLWNYIVDKSSVASS
jgi:Tfp pilus assembly protein PilZ